jgi:hypothetical protein
MAGRRNGNLSSACKMSENFDLQVSSGCEVLQINKKFFIRHADEAVLTLIKVNVS